MLKFRPAEIGGQWDAQSDGRSEFDRGDWLFSAPEEIQAEIAHRHFEDCLALVQKQEEYLVKDSSFREAPEIGEKIKVEEHTFIGSNAGTA